MESFLNKKDSNEEKNFLPKHILLCIHQDSEVPAQLSPGSSVPAWTGGAPAPSSLPPLAAYWLISSSDFQQLL